MTIPEDLLREKEKHSVVLPQGVVIDYEATEDLPSQRVLISRPTLVLVRSGMKKFSSVNSSQYQLAKEGCLIAFRSGSHLMSEFRTEESSYRSYVISLERSFLEQAIGVPKDGVESEPPRSTVVSLSESEAWQRLLMMPSSIRKLSSETEKEFRLREFVLQALADPIVRSMFYHEVADWTTSTEHRISAILNAHCLSPLTIAELALLCGMSLASFKRHFQQIYGESPGQWVHRTRLEYAFTLAKRNELSTKEICEASGYQDVSSFTRAFTREFGRTARSVGRENG